MSEELNNLEELQDQVTLTLDDGTEMVCDILAIFPCNDKEYIALLPQKPDEEGEIFLYRFVDHDDADAELLDIEDDEEFEAASDAFDELLDAEEFDEVFEDEDEEEDEEE